MKKPAVNEDSRFQQRETAEDSHPSQKKEVMWPNAPALYN